ncbi:MAG: hypothetical protein AMXMBFR57_00630 [Acidimicrobiia bacterium]
MLNIVVVNPMPSARAMMARADVPGRFRIIRTAYLRSCPSPCIDSPVFHYGTWRGKVDGLRRIVIVKRDAEAIRLRGLVRRRDTD